MWLVVVADTEWDRPSWGGGGGEERLTLRLWLGPSPLATTYITRSGIPRSQVNSDWDPPSRCGRLE